jgi:hypothetical protein
MVGEGEQLDGGVGQQAYRQIDAHQGHLLGAPRRTRLQRQQQPIWHGQHERHPHSLRQEEMIHTPQSPLYNEHTTIHLSATGSKHAQNTLLTEELGQAMVLK